MGTKSNSVSNPDLAKPHAAGSVVRILQNAEHGQWGTISFEVRRLWILHRRLATDGYNQLVKLHQEVLRAPVGSSNSRILTKDDDPDLTALVYAAGTQMVLNTVLTMQHFCHEVERTLRLDANQSTLAVRIKETFTRADLKLPAGSRGYAALREILERRDAIEHPKNENTFNSHPNDWDRVPLSWLLTERSLRAFLYWHEWFTETIDEWEAHPERQPRRRTLTVERGKMSTRQTKKPPKE
jgi:hypothetical protein